MSTEVKKIEQHAVGGQAVIEGVMMRSPRFWALAVRKPDGGIHTESHETGAAAKKRPWLGKPFVRGVMALGEAMGIGFRAMSTSARVSAGEEDAPTKKEMAIAIVVALIFTVGLFFVLPNILGGRRVVERAGVEALLYNLRDGLIRIGIFLAYILGISLMPDIRRVFQYHGAEHKVIAAHENGEPATPDAAKPYSTVHVRCGTDFLFLVMIVSVLVFSLLGRPPLFWRIGLHIVLLPVVAGISYELLRLSARHEHNILIRALTFPGRLLQRVTTREPDDSQLEVAVASLHELMRVEGITPPPAGPDLPSGDVPDDAA